MNRDEKYNRALVRELKSQMKEISPTLTLYKKLEAEVKELQKEIDKNVPALTLEEMKNLYNSVPSKHIL